MDDAFPPTVQQQAYSQQPTEIIIDGGLNGQRVVHFSQREDG